MRRLLLLALAFTTRTVLAWGPHSEIAQAALDTLESQGELEQVLGPDLRRLREYVWMADYRSQLISRPDEVYYADDFLLFPAAPNHIDHLCPAVEKTYGIYFRRSLQALRTESPLNAARWIGALLHFTTDTGSPPHSARLVGPVHSKMENWVDAKAIHIPGYRPQLLGKDDAEAEAGFIRRMEGLIEFSKERATRCRADVDGDRRELVEPVVLESALETARVTADLLYTLGVLVPKSAPGATLTGRVLLPKIDHALLARLPAKVLLLGTSYSTLADAEGAFVFRNLPAGTFRAVASAPGILSAEVSVTLDPAHPAALSPLDLTRPEAPGNLVRNPGFQLRWIAPDRADDWSQPKRPRQSPPTAKVRITEGEWISLEKDTSYVLRVRWKAVLGSSDPVDGPQVWVNLKAKPSYDSLVTESTPVTVVTREAALASGPDAMWAQVVIRTPQGEAPESLIESVSLAAVR